MKRASSIRRPDSGSGVGVSYRVQLGLMLAPYLAGLAILVAIPALAGLPLAFTDYNALERPVFAGLDNFTELWRDDVFHTALFNSLSYIAVATPLRLAGALALALLLAAPMRGVRLYRMLVYLPTVIPDLAWAIVWLWVLNPLYGPLNQFLALFGINGPAWMLGATSARLAIVIMLAWQIGEGFVVCLAALQDVPRELTDQAAVDGASAWRSFWGLVLPTIAPVLLILLFRDTIHSLQANFVPALIVGRGGGPNYATTYLPTYIYTTAFDFLRLGYAAAMTWALYALTVIVVWLQYRVAVRWRLGFRDVE